MDSRKLLELASGTADYSQHLAVERNLEQPSGIRGFTDKQNLIGSSCDAHRIGRADHGRKSIARWRLAVDRRDPWRRWYVDGEQTKKFTVGIENLNAPVGAVNNNIYVGDRSNRRVQVFDTDGKFLRMFTIDVPPPPGIPPVYGETPTGDRLAAVIGAPNSMCITPGPNQVLFIGETTYPGRLFKVSLDGKVLGVIGRSGRQLKQFSGVHQLACPSETEVYAAETSNWRVQKLVFPASTQVSRAGR